ncbi:hypothetical protein PROFUN_14073 [Planoprotostelium fungivorum]|uniref:Uncharacterized protein n=1 Tax=Planoprotostelium fungivorum TaxID=1890364 RepID=A0A2P6N1Z7_9EUKA|nr:hypothetical protein PROFUN_14073 [Planoprotostelium fungivorum]
MTACSGNNGLFSMEQFIMNVAITDVMNNHVTLLEISCYCPQRSNAKKPSKNDTSTQGHIDKAFVHYTQMKHKGTDNIIRAVDRVFVLDITNKKMTEAKYASPTEEQRRKVRFIQIRHDEHRWAGGAQVFGIEDHPLSVQLGIQGHYVDFFHRFWSYLSYTFRAFAASEEFLSTRSRRTLTIQNINTLPPLVSGLVKLPEIKRRRRASLSLAEPNVKPQKQRNPLKSLKPLGIGTAVRMGAKLL